MTPPPPASPAVDSRVSPAAAESQRHTGEENNLGLGAVIRRPAWWRRLLAFLWKWAVASVLCLQPVTAVLVVGWTARAVRRSAVRRWFRNSVWATAGSYPAFATEQMTTAPLVHMPSWLIAPASIWASDARPSLFRRLGASLVQLWTYLRDGVSIAFNTFVLTLPGLGLMHYAWWAGWNNSFHKGYEQAVVGPTTFIAGVALFAVAMLFVPLAQARQSVTGCARNFWDLRLVAGLARRHWLRSLFLSGLYALISIPLMAVLAAPVFLGNQPEWEALSDAELLGKVNQFYFAATALLVFPGFLFLRLVAARTYSSCVLAEVRSGRMREDDLGPFERECLLRLGHLHEIQEQTSPSLMRRGFGTVGAFVGWIALLLGSFMIWFAVVSEVMVAQFFAYRPATGFLNHAFLHLPWIRQIPGALGS